MKREGDRMKRLNQPAMLKFIKKELKTMKTERDEYIPDKLIRLTVPDIAKRIPNERDSEYKRFVLVTSHIFVTMKELDSQTGRQMLNLKMFMNLRVGIIVKKKNQ